MNKREICEKVLSELGTLHSTAVGMIITKVHAKDITPEEAAALSEYTNLISRMNEEYKKELETNAKKAEELFDDVVSNARKVTGIVIDYPDSLIKELSLEDDLEAVQTATLKMAVSILSASLGGDTDGKER